ncbi:MAG: hypothetical protein KQI62_09500 [Deltaproteobacteria bacterium]|nr:hypothetical protein [Deltaproteobacteria bacterium]
MSLPYHLSRELASVFRLETKFCRFVFDVLIAGDLLLLALSELGKISALDKNDKRIFSNLSVYFVLRHIVYRTIQFARPLEFIRVADIINGLPTIGAFGCGVSERTVRPILKGLSPPTSDFLIRVQFPRDVSVTPMYGLNLPGLLSLAAVTWDAAIAEVEITRSEKYNADERDWKEEEAKLQPRSRLAKTTMKKLDKCIAYIDYYKNCYIHLSKQAEPINDFDAFLKSIREKAPSPYERERAEDVL